MNLEKEIQSAIEANLPAATAKVLAERLQLGEKAIEENKALKEQSAEARKAIDLKLDLELREKQLISKENSYNAEKQAFAIEKAVLETTKKLLAERNNDIFKLVETVFKNPVVRTHSSGSVPVKDSYGFSTQPTFNTTHHEVEGTV